MSGASGIDRDQRARSGRHTIDVNHGWTNVADRTWPATRAPFRLRTTMTASLESRISITARGELRVTCIETWWRAHPNSATAAITSTAIGVGRLTTAPSEANASDTIATAATREGRGETRS